MMKNLIKKKIVSKIVETSQEVEEYGTLQIETINKEEVHKLLTSIKNGIEDVNLGQTRSIDKLWDELND